MTMKQCDQLRPYLDGELGRMGQWRMQHHLRRCPACTAQTEAEQSLRPWLTDPAGDFENEAEAASRVTQVWLDVLPEMHARPRRRSRGRRGWLTFSAAVGLAAAVFLVGVVTAPRRAVAQ